MLVYSKKKLDFLGDVRANRIHSEILETMRKQSFHAVSDSEIASWRNSLQFVGNVLADDEIPQDSFVSIEYRIPLTNKRVDVIVSGKDAESRHSAVVIELKQWSKVSKTDIDGTVRTFLGGSERDVPHPSYQAWSYVQTIRDFNTAVQDKEIELTPCAFLHNLDDPEVINDDFYRAYTQLAPVFIASDGVNLAKFIKDHVKYGDPTTMYHIENGKLRPSKDLADSLVSMMNGNSEFTLLDEQKLVYETAIHLAKKAQEGEKQVLIVEGGPGTGKSVVAVNLLVELTRLGLVCQYVSKNAAPRYVYTARLAQGGSPARVRNLFRGSGAYIKTDPDTFGGLIVDEAHRLNEKSGLYGNLGENQIKEIVNSARFSVFFIDEAQQVTWSDIGRKADIRGFAELAGAAVTQMELVSQFRCNGSDGYLAWVDDVLGIRRTANESLADIDYEVRVFDSPVEMRLEIERLNDARNRARLVAGYCWDWKSRKDSSKMDIVIPEFGFEAQWNLSGDNTWMISPKSVEQVGCIHTSQGLELDHIGVIIGSDLLVRDGKVVTNPEARAKTDQSLRGSAALLKADRASAFTKADAIIKNTYRTLMTRGSKSCFIFATDEETRDYFHQRITYRP